MPRGGLYYNYGNYFFHHLYFAVNNLDIKLESDLHLLLRGDFAVLQLFSCGQCPLQYSISAWSEDPDKFEFAGHIAQTDAYET